MVVAQASVRYNVAGRVAMQGKLSNASLVVVLLVAFSLFVAGLTHSTDGDRVVQAGATPTPTRTPTPVNIGNFVWFDSNGNGIQDDGEPGVPNVTVQLWNSAKSNLIAQGTTNGSGMYTVVTPIPGDYRVRWVLPPNSAFTLKDQGSDQLDSDANPIGSNLGFTDIFTIASNVISTTIYDAGLVSDLPQLQYVALTPARLLDTRGQATVDGNNVVGKRVAGTTLTLTVAGRGGVPFNAKAATINLTAVKPAAGNGYLTTYPCDAAQPTASSLNTTGVTIANEIVVKLSAAGQICIFTSVATDLIVDVVGAHVP